MYEVVISHEAEKHYKRQDTKAKRKINRCIDTLEKDPLSGAHVKRLHGQLEGKYRLAMGGLRIIYDVETEKKIVRFTRSALEVMFIRNDVVGW